MEHFLGAWESPGCLRTAAAADESGGESGPLATQDTVSREHQEDPRAVGPSKSPGAPSA